MNLKTVSLATFNLFNLNEPGRAIYTNKNGWTQEQYDKKIAWTASQLRLLAADIFGFQELWHPDSLHNALNASGLADRYDLLIPEEANGTKIVCASLVRKGLLAGAPKWIHDFPEAFVLRSEGDDPQTPLIEVNIRGFSRQVLHFTVMPREQGLDSSSSAEKILSRFCSRYVAYRCGDTCRPSFNSNSFAMRS